MQMFGTFVLMRCQVLVSIVLNHVPKGLLNKPRNQLETNEMLSLALFNEKIETTARAEKEEK